MPAVTYYVALPILKDEAGELYPGEAIEAQTSSQAVSKAAAFARSHAGAVAFSRTGDTATGEFEEAVVLASHGELPGDIAAMIGGAS